MSGADYGGVWYGGRLIKRRKPPICSPSLPPTKVQPATTIGTNAREPIVISDDDDGDDGDEIIEGRKRKRKQPAELRPAPPTKFDDVGIPPNKSFELPPPMMEQPRPVLLLRSLSQVTRILTAETMQQRSVLNTRNVLGPRNEAVGLRHAPLAQLPGIASQFARTPVNARQQVDVLDSQLDSLAQQSSTFGQTVSAPQPVEHGFLFEEEPLSQRMRFNSSTGVYNIDQPPMDVPLMSIVAQIVGENWEFRGNRANKIAAFFGMNSQYNRVLPQAREEFVDPSLDMAPLALAAKFALDLIYNMTKSEERFESITHIVLCTDQSQFLSILNDWKWIYQNNMWTLTKKGRGRWVHTNYPQVCSLLAKLVDLRQEHFQVSFHKADAGEMEDAYATIKDLGQKDKSFEDGPQMP